MWHKYWYDFVSKAGIWKYTNIPSSYRCFYKELVWPLITLSLFQMSSRHVCAMPWWHLKGMPVAKNAYLYLWWSIYNSSCLTALSHSTPSQYTHSDRHTDTLQPDVPHSLLLALFGIYRAISVITMPVSIIKHSHMPICSHRHLTKPHAGQLSPQEPSRSNQWK